MPNPFVSLEAEAEENDSDNGDSDDCGDLGWFPISHSDSADGEIT
jgi:hypothetical protein